MAHTPEPWERHGKWPTNIKDENGEMIATVWNRGDETEFNVLLIVRAPELQAEAEADRRLALLRRVECVWSDWKACPICRQMQTEGHADGCELAAELKENHNGGDYENL